MTAGAQLSEKLSIFDRNSNFRANFMLLVTPLFVLKYAVSLVSPGQRYFCVLQDEGAGRWGTAWGSDGTAQVMLKAGKPV